MKERIFYSTMTGRIYGSLQNDRIDTRRAIKRNLLDFTLVGQNSVFHTYEREVADTHTQPLPLLQGNEAKTFYDIMHGGDMRAKVKMRPGRGYFKAVKHWIAFDNTGETWIEETFEEERMCIEWFK